MPLFSLPGLLAIEWISFEYCWASIKYPMNPKKSNANLNTDTIIFKTNDGYFVECIETFRQQCRLNWGCICVCLLIAVRIIRSQVHVTPCVWLSNRNCHSNKDPPEQTNLFNYQNGQCHESLNCVVYLQATCLDWIYSYIQRRNRLGRENFHLYTSHIDTSANFWIQ